ncbi:MAG: hypothetical protein ACE366_25560 [Bradymonadia bacterium]
MRRPAGFLGIGCVVAVVPLIILGIEHLSVRDYVGGGLLIFAAAAVGHLGLELMALSEKGGGEEVQ